MDLNQIPKDNPVLARKVCPLCFGVKSRKATVCRKCMIRIAVSGIAYCEFCKPGNPCAYHQKVGGEGCPQCKFRSPCHKHRKACNTCPHCKPGIPCKWHQKGKGSSPCPNCKPGELCEWHRPGAQNCIHCKPGEPCKWHRKGYRGTHIWDYCPNCKPHNPCPIHSKKKRLCKCGKSIAVRSKQCKECFQNMVRRAAKGPRPKYCCCRVRPYKPCEVHPFVKGPTMWMQDAKTKKVCRTWPDGTVEIRKGKKHA